MEIIMAILIMEINAKITAEGYNFSQQYILPKVLKIYKERGLTSAPK